MSQTLEQAGTPWSESYRGSGRPTGRLAKEPVYCQNGDVAPGWSWVGDMSQAEFDVWFDDEEAAQTAFARGLCGG